MEEDECPDNLDRLNCSYDSTSGLISDEDYTNSLSEDSDSDIETDQVVSFDHQKSIAKTNRQKRCMSLRNLSISMSSIDKRSKPKQPHIIYMGTIVDIYNRETNKPRASVSEVLNALDMHGAVRDIKRFNYVCRLVQLIINEKFNQLSGNAQRTLFLIVKEMLVQVIRTQENTNTMRKLLIDFKKVVQDSTNFYYFYHIGSQKLGEKHLETINKWQKKLENSTSSKRPKRLSSSNSSKKITTNETEIIDDKENNTVNTTNIEKIPFDCKLEIMRRLNSGLDLVNLSKCSRGLNQIISEELSMWKNLCKFHFQQTNINSLVSSSYQLKSAKSIKVMKADDKINELDWKSIYFKLKKRYGHREVYVDMIQQCFHCKCLFWKEIGHPCVIIEGLAPNMQLDPRIEPITPKKLIHLLQL